MMRYTLLVKWRAMQTFETTDDRLLKRLRVAGGIEAMLPQEAIAFMENWYEN
jgi:hypothetical protein